MGNRDSRYLLSFLENGQAIQHKDEILFYFPIIHFVGIFLISSGLFSDDFEVYLFCLLSQLSFKSKRLDNNRFIAFLKRNLNPNFIHNR